MSTGIMYQHDSATMFRFVLRGEFSGKQVQELEYAWTTAQPILDGKALVVDISEMTRADEPALKLLSRMQESGACVRGAAPTPHVAPPRRTWRSVMSRLTRAAGRD